MGTAVADTGPLHYLVLTKRIDVLPVLFDVIAIPKSVEAELSAPEAPEPVRAWILAPPPWLRVCLEASETIKPARSLDDGERDTIALAVARKADMVLMDDRAGVAAARRLNLTVTGTLGLLVLSARRGLLDLADAFDQLRATNFRVRADLLDELLAAHLTRVRR